MAAEQFVPGPVLLPVPDHDADHQSTEEPKRREASNASSANVFTVSHRPDYGPSPPTDRTQRISRRAESACAIVTPSAYSRSPPTGIPRAIRETVTGEGAN